MLEMEFQGRHTLWKWSSRWPLVLINYTGWRNKEGRRRKTVDSTTDLKMRSSTSFSYLVMAGLTSVLLNGIQDCSVKYHVEIEEKSYLEAANRMVDYLEEGNFAKIINVEEDEPHIQRLRSLNRNLYDITTQLPWSN